jgi:DNA-binding transcriptional MocR family regulator
MRIVAGQQTSIASLCPVLEQPVLAAFINEGHFARHIRCMRLLYRLASALTSSKRDT